MTSRFRFLFLAIFTLSFNANASDLEAYIQSKIARLPVEHQNFFRKNQITKITWLQGRYAGMAQDRCLDGKYILQGTGEVSYRVIEISLSALCPAATLDKNIHLDLLRTAYKLQIQGLPTKVRDKVIRETFTQKNIPNIFNQKVNLEQGHLEIAGDYYGQQEYRPISPAGPPEILAKVKLLYTPLEAWAYRYRVIKEAKHSIRIQTYILVDDIFTQGLTALLIDALNRGVKVQFSVDSKGTFTNKNNRLLHALKEHGADVRVSNPVFEQILNVFKFFRIGFLNTLVSTNHDKIILVDDTKLITGGRNIGAKYFLENGEAKIPSFQDLDVYAVTEKKNLEAILAFNLEFYISNQINLHNPFKRISETLRLTRTSLKTLESYMFNSSSPLPILKSHEVHSLESLRGYKNCPFTLTSKAYPILGVDKTSSHIPINNISQAILKDFEKAQDSIYMVNPYLILTDNFDQSLQRLFQRNKRIKVKIVTTSPKTTSSVLTQAYLLKNITSLLKKFPRLEVYAYTGNYYLHAKYFIIDNRISYVGSYNLDYLSEYKNSEFKVRINSDLINSELRSFTDNSLIANSIKYDPANGVGPNVFPPESLKRFKKFEFLSGLLKGIL